jgi:hypothetical protein
MKLITTIEIDEITTDVEIDFINRFGEIEVDKITDSVTGCAICPELSDDIYSEMMEMWADVTAETERGWFI